MLNKYQLLATYSDFIEEKHCKINGKYLHKFLKLVNFELSAQKMSKPFLIGVYW